MTITSASRITLICLLAALAAPSRALGQGTSGSHPRREIPGLDFHRDGVWRKRARQVAARRAAMLARGQFGALNAPLAARGGPSLAAVTGTFRVPAILFKYADTPTGLRDTAEYNAVLFAPTPPLGRPYTYRTFYEELSNGLLSVQGQTYGYAALDSNEVTYTGAPPCTGNPYPGSTNCNGLFDGGQVPPDPVTRMQRGLTEALRKLDASIDWTQYDSDGDGYVDLVVFIQPAQDGACGGNNHLWSHRYVLGFPYSTEFTTHSPAPGGGFEKVRDYILESGVGGDPVGCDPTQIMPIGTVAHETGHGFGLPDLYDTQGPTEGIGDWGLMGAGNYTSASSPSRMEAWSLNELGWVTLAPLAAAGTYRFGAAPVSDTAFYVGVRGSNPRGEYFLLENRQASQSDTAMIRVRCQRSGAPANCPGGLLIWHVDSAQVVNGGLGNTVNFGTVHGLALVQADGLRDLDAPRNRGDAGDDYPGIAKLSTPSPLNPNTAFSFSTTPAATRNVDGKFVGFAIDSVRQTVPGSTMQFRLRFGQPLVFIAGAHGTVSASPPADTSGSFLAESSAVMLTAAPSNGFIFAGWNGDTSTASAGLMLSMVHPYNVTANFGTQLLVTSADALPGAVMGTAYLDTLKASGGTGSYTWQLVGPAPPSLALSTSGVITGIPSQLGTFSLQAQVTSVSLVQTHTFSLITTAPILATATVVAELLNGTGPLSVGAVTYLDLLGNHNGQFDLGDFLAWVNVTGAPAPSLAPNSLTARPRATTPRDPR